ncbi:aminotransferase class IV [Haloplanus aerogenes]|uniref:Aminodeoxychorismate lyase n=1 Tax=Haloplanus aerogenes TaxID=660522 RepID=A0A3M0CZ26_9EURY|nr:aminotransferase class IV [Haloplanus aerogenes]AZH26626.1 aminodeoxychorismate lyase [Haloplanus aerogenes]RMB12859.1 branched-chain amino acid aminotransferase [Haloplanus aerogenes]
MQYHVNGQLVDASEATISVEDRGFLYGDAAFETCRAYGGEVFEWDGHLTRLRGTCETLGMGDAVPDDLHERIEAALDANDLADAYVRLSVTRGVQPGKLTPAEDVDPSVVIIVKPLPRGGVDGEKVWDAPADVRTVDHRRIPEVSMPADAKTHNYLDGILARLELRGTDADECLVRDVDGAVAEGATSNVFFVDDGTLKTPSLAGPILPGVTRAVVLDLAGDLGIPVETGAYDPEAVRRADEAFLTNTTWEVRPVAVLDGVAIGGGPITDRLAAAFDRRVEACYDAQ